MNGDEASDRSQISLGSQLRKEEGLESMELTHLKSMRKVKMLLANLIGQLSSAARF